MKEKVKILGIVPYEGMKILLENLAATRSDLIIDVYVGDLQAGADIARLCENRDYHVIISRGGTAKMIRESSSIPIVEIEFTAYDILRAVKLAQTYKGQFALVGFSSLTKNAQAINDLLQYQLDIYTINSHEEAQLLLCQMEKKNYQLILCDRITDTLARSHNLNSILVTSGSEALEYALNRAVQIGQTYLFYKNRYDFLKKVMDRNSTELLVYSQDCRLLFSSLKTVPEASFLPLFQKMLPGLIKSENAFAQKKLLNLLVSVHKDFMEFHMSGFYIFTLEFQALAETQGAKDGITYFLREDAAQRFLQHFYGIFHAASKKPVFEVQDYEVFNRTSAPIVICGENGTGKQQAAAAIFCHSPLQNRPFIWIDFRLLTDKSLKFLFHHSDSPLYAINSTLYFSGIEVLPEKTFDNFISILQSSDLSRRNRLIFSCDTSPQAPLHPHVQYLIDQLACLVMELLPLRSLQPNIATLATLYIASYNREYGKEIAGIHPDALALLEKYEWPHNLKQFKRAMSSLVLNTHTSYIEAETVARFLGAERKLFSSPGESPADFPIDLSRSLSEINHDIIQYVMNAHHGNQTKAAQQLNISRSTLWRILNKS